MSEISWIQGFMAGMLTVVFILLMLCLIVITWLRSKTEKKDPADWWRRGEEPPQYN